MWQIFEIGFYKSLVRFKIECIKSNKVENINAKLWWEYWTINQQIKSTGDC